MNSRRSKSQTPGVGLQTHLKRPWTRREEATDKFYFKLTKNYIGRTVGMKSGAGRFGVYFARFSRPMSLIRRSQRQITEARAFALRCQ